MTAWIELIEEEDEELVEELANARRISRLPDILLLDDIEIVLKEGIRLDHAEDSRVRITALTVSIVGSTALLALKLFDRHRVVDRLGLL